MPPLLSGTGSPSSSSVPSPLTFSRAVWRHICLMSHIHNCDVTFLSYCVYFPSFCLVSVWYHGRFWAWRLVAVETGAIENWHYYYYCYCYCYYYYYYYYYYCYYHYHYHYYYYYCYYHYYYYYHYCCCYYYYYYIIIIIIIIIIIVVHICIILRLWL